MSGERKYGDLHDFTIAMKAAAWEAQHMLRQEPGNVTVAVHNAVMDLDLIENIPTANVNQYEIMDAVRILAFEEPDLPNIDWQLTRAWAEYRDSGKSASEAETPSMCNREFYDSLPAHPDRDDLFRPV